MNVNIKSLSINIRTDYDIDNRNRERTSIEFRFQVLGENREYPHSFYVSGRGVFPKAVSLMFDCLNGESEFYPFFDDITYLIRFHDQGIVFKDTSKQHGYQDLWLTYPGKLIANRILQLINAQSNKMTGDKGTVESSYTFTQDEIELARRQYAPLYAVEWGNCQQDWLLARDNHLVSEEGQKRLTRAYEHLIAIAKNYSDGKLVTIYLSRDHAQRDDIPMSFCFDIRTHDNKRIMNGGIIAHCYDREGETYYEYNMHT